MAEERAAFLAEQPWLVSGDMVFIDESNVNRAMTRYYARSRRGRRAYGEAPRNYART